jgi:bifunctional ADP-heptose synthase (sugar kinase/adenylyltransferase)
MSNDAIEEHLQQLHIQLHEQLQHKISLITLPSFKLFFQKGSYAKTIASHTQNIADVSGCEDTIIAVAALVYTAEKNMLLAASLASLAAGVVCAHVGTVAINKQQLLAECRKSLN